MIGFVFADEHEAKTFYKKVMMKKDAKGMLASLLLKRASTLMKDPSEIEKLKQAQETLNLKRRQD